MVTPDSPPLGTTRWGTMIPLIGGSALGCSRATGNLPLFHLSYSAFAANESHLSRHWPSVPTYRLDKTTFSVDKVLAGGDIDFINSVCPCAGLSMLNTASKGPSGRGADAIQNEWMIKSAQFVMENVKPKVLWGENAPGLFLSLGQAMVPRLRALGLEYGYSFSMVKTNTQLHGLPQMRMRTFYFFWRSPTVPLLHYIKREAPPLIEYLKAIPADATFQDKFVTEGKVSERFKPYLYVLLREGLTHQEFAKKMSEKHGVITISKYLEKYNLLDDCIKWLQVYFPKERWSVNTKGNGKSRTHIQYLEHMREKLKRGLGYWDDSPKFMLEYTTAVITKNVVFAVHPEEDRFLNIREIMHLMGLPHDYQIDDPKNWNHVCQNVPLNTARDWAEEVIKFCRGELEMTSFSFLKQDNCSQRIVEKEFGEIKQEIKVEQDMDDYPELKSQELTVGDLHALAQGGVKREQGLEEDVNEMNVKKLKLEIKKETEPISFFKIKEEPYGLENHIPEHKNKLNSFSQSGLRQPLKTLLVPKVEKIGNNLKQNPKIETKEQKPKTESKSDKSNVKQLDSTTSPTYSPRTMFQCGLCKQVAFQSKSELNLHFVTCKVQVGSSRVETSQPSTQYSCGLCQYKVSSKLAMTEHWVSGCDKMFSKNTSSSSNKRNIRL